MKRKLYKPIRRREKRIYTHSVRHHKKLRRLILLSLILGLLLLIFLPGHNGLISLAAKRLEIQRLHNEIERLKIEMELIQAKIAKTEDPRFIKRYAYEHYGMIPKSDTLNPTPKPPNN
ncbi:MAG: septum formation initiator family protein [candidate division WOR-3 bacterium]